MESNLRMNIEGVNVIGFVKGEFGLGQGVRMTIKALEAAGIPVCTLNFNAKTPHHAEDTLISNIETSPKYSINIIQINPDMLDEFTRLNGSELLKGRYNIAFWAWELDRYPDMYQRFFDYFDEVWTPSTFCVEAIAAKSPVPVLAFPHPITQNQSTIDRNILQLPVGKFILLSLFDFLSSIERKNIFGIIDAFEKAFGKDDSSVLLVLKANNSEMFPDQLARLKNRIVGFVNILLINKRYERSHIDGLIKVSNVLVSLHRGEGFGLTMAEAMAAGKPVIATDYSGNRDFMHSGNSFLVPYKMIAVSDINPCYTKGNMWADPDIDEAAKQMLLVRHNPEMANKVAQQGFQDITDNLSFAHIGEKMRARLQLIIAQGWTRKTETILQNKIGILEIEYHKLAVRNTHLEKTLYNKLRKKFKKIFHPNKAN